MGKYPRGIEKIIALAALDAAFKKRLLADREAAIDSCGIKLTDTEREMLVSIPHTQLKNTINKVHVSTEARRMFLTGAIGAAITIAVGASIIIPSMIPAGIRSESAFAIAGLRIVATVQVHYRDRFGRYAKTLKELEEAEYIDTLLGSGKKHGYTFELSNVTENSFELRAIPEKEGKRFFFVNESGVIRYSNSPGVGPDSEPIE